MTKVAEDKASKEEVSIEVLAGLIASGKATPADMARLADMLSKSVEDKKKEEFQQKIDEIKAYIDERGLTVQQVYDALKGPAVCYFRYVDKDGKAHERFEGEKGPFPSWVAQMKNEITKTQALEIAGNNEKAKAFVEKVYK